MFRSSGVFGLTAAALLLFPTILFAQTGVAGIVTDSTGGALPGVTVTLTGENVMGSRVAVTDASGAYRFELPSPGVVQIQFELAGFDTVRIEGVQVRAGTTTTAHAKLQVATLEETVTVVGATPVVDRESATVGVNFTTQMLQDLPNARDMWVVLSQSPGVTMSRFDVGGSSAGVQTGYTSYGFGGQNFVGLDGIMTTEGTGGAIVYMDYGSFGEVQIVGAAKGADIAVPGTFINTVVKTGTNQYRGEFYGDWEDDSFQGNNLSDELRVQGVLSGDRITRYNDFNWQLGGPILRDRLWFFYSGRDQYIGVEALGFTDDLGNPAPFYTELTNHGVKLNAKVADQHELTYFGSYNRKYQPYRGGGGGGGGGEGRFFTTSSAGEQDMPTPAHKAQWMTTALPESTFDVSFNYVGQDFSIRRRVDEVSRRDLDTQLVRGGYSGVTPGFTGTSQISIPFSWLRKRAHVNATWSWFTDRLGGGSHNLKSGYMFLFEEFRFPQYGTYDHAVYYYRDNFQTPAFVETYDTPLETIDRLRQHSFYVNDRWTVGRHWTLNLGVRLDSYTNYYPPQGNPGTGPFATAFSVPGRTLPRLANWVPRLSAIYDVFGDGWTAIKASYGRYNYNPGVTLATEVNPVSRTQRRYRWDGTLPFVPNETDLVSVVGGRERDIAPDFRNSYVDEWTIGIDQQLTAQWLVRFNVVRRYDKDRFQLINAAQPFEAFNTPVTVSDPGPDGRFGTGDDGELVLYSLEPALVGEFRGLLINAPGYENNYLSYDVQVSKSLSRNFDLLGSITANRIQQWPTGVPQNPNDANYSNYEDYWEVNAKLMGSYYAPWNVRLSSVIKSQSGAPYGRQFRNPSGTLSQGTITVFAEPVGTYRYPTVALWDVRAARTFDLGRVRLEGMFDLFNVLNRGTVTAVTTLTGPNFRTQPIRILNPRIAKIGVRVTF